jgi:transcriptional regulator with XRE-family HTH domain
MGRARKPRPKRLAEKLRWVRVAVFNISQEEMIRRLGYPADEVPREYVSRWELGTHEPPLEVLLRYSELCRCWINVFVDDTVDLPERLPGPGQKMHEGIRRTSKEKGKPGK